MAGKIIGVPNTLVLSRTINQVKGDLFKTRKKFNELKRKLRYLQHLEKLHIEAERTQSNGLTIDEWFQGEWNKTMRHPDDRYKEKLGSFVPACHNPTFKYVIVVDNERHDYFSDHYKRLGYQVFRVKAYNTYELEYIYQFVVDIRKNSNKQRVIVRKKNV